MKKFFIESCVVACLCHTVLTQRDVRLPPTLTRCPQGKTLLYNNRSQFTLECGAKGTPSVKYEWKKNGFQLNTSLSNIRKESDGTITVNGPTERDEGYYQCFAKNQYGTTLSNMIHVQMIFIEPSSGTPPVLEITVVQGMPFYIQSHQHKSFPKPLYDWYTAVDIDAQYPAKLRPSERIQFADDGNREGSPFSTA